MKSPAELFVESLTLWPEPMPPDNMTSDDWYDVVFIFTGTRIKSDNENIGLALAESIESPALTIDNFRGNEALFMFAFQALTKTYDVDRIQKFHKIHGTGVADWMKSEPKGREKIEFFENIFTPKEA